MSSRWLWASALALLLHGTTLWGLRDVWAPLSDTASMRKFEAVYARQVQLSAAPVAAVRAAPAAGRRAAAGVLAPAPAASEPESPPQPTSSPTPAASDPAPPPIDVAASQAGSDMAAQAAASAPSVASGSGSASSPTPAPVAASAPAFEWPVATRVRYRVLGHYRGEVHGSATVEWLRQHDRYQAHLTVSAAGVFTRRMSSEGRITAAGLVPERYLQVDEFLGSLFGKPRTVDMRLDRPTIDLANGQQVPSLPLVQDTASQFIQFIYLLTTDARLQRPGSTVDLALALPRSVRTWRYEVAPIDTVATPDGTVDTLHLRPVQSAPAGDWTVEIWFAPRLQMLPVQFRLRQSEQVYFDLFIDQMPEQAGK